MRDKIFCYDIYSDSLEFSFNDFKTYGFNTAEVFRYRLKKNGKVKDSIPFYKITKKNDTVFEIKVYPMTFVRQRPNRKLISGNYSIHECLFNKNGDIKQINRIHENYLNKNYKSPPFTFDTILYFYSLNKQIIKEISKTTFGYSYFNDTLSITFDTITLFYEYNKDNKIEKLKSVYKNKFIFQNQWYYNEKKLISKIERRQNHGTNTDTYYFYDSMNRLISENKTKINSQSFHSFGNYDSTLTEYSYLNNKILKKTIKEFKFGFSKRHPKIEFFDTFGNVIQFCYSTYKDTFSYCDFTFYKYNNNKIEFKKYTSEYYKNTNKVYYTNYPNGFLKEERGLGKYQRVFRYYYKQ